jgi:tetratricopeptide (TPR) repeat protein
MLARLGFGAVARVAVGAIAGTLVAGLVVASAVVAGPVDETALREYARQKRTDRVEMETRRLERLHPDWKPPADLWTARPSGPDEAPLWELFESGDLVRLHKAIAARQAAEPDWQPSDDLLDKIKTSELRAAIFAGAAGGKWAAVGQLADDNGLGGGTSDIELLWVVAEAFARTERAADAAALYEFVLKNRTDISERTATIQKALALLSMADAEKLIAMGRVGPDGKSEFEVIRVDIARARIAAFLRNDPAKTVDAADLAAVENAAREASDAGQPRLLAWYAYRLGQFDTALDWFKLSLDREGDAMTAHGLALTMLKLGSRRDAEEVAYTWREQLSNNMILFIDILETDLTREIPPFVEPARLARYAEVTLKTQSGEGAQGLAWYAYNTCQFQTAHEWFGRAVAWFPKEATVYGYGLTLQRLGKHHELVEIANRYDGMFPRVVGLLFRDDYIHPPTPCEIKAHPELVARAKQRREMEADRVTSSMTDAGYIPAGAGYTQTALPATKTKSAANDPFAGRRIARADFPIPVYPENPLRFPLRGGTPPDRGTRFGQFRTDGPLNPPRQARRVPGAEAMPYERYGITLLPAYNGVTTVSFRAGAYRAAANGTMWAEEYAAPARGASIAPTSSLRAWPTP